MNHKNDVTRSRLDWAATGTGALGLLLALALLGKPPILVGVFDIALPTVLGVAAIVLARKAQNPHRWIGLITGGISVLIAIVAVAVLLFDDSFNDDDVMEHGTSTGSSDNKKQQPASKQGALIDSGFGQGGDEYVGLAALVKNRSDHAGQTVTVSWNLKDSDGKLLATESQVESFAWAGQELPVITQGDVKPGERVASVEATLLVEDEGTFSNAVSSDLGSSDAPLTTDGWGTTTAQARLKNPTKKVLKSPGVKVICRDADGKIAGSGWTFAELIAPHGDYADDVDVIVSSGAKTCRAYLVPGA